MPLQHTLQDRVKKLTTNLERRFLNTYIPRLSNMDVS